MTKVPTTRCAWALPQNSVHRAWYLSSSNTCMSQSLSHRGRDLQTAAPKSLATAYAARADRYDRDTNPNGFIDLSVSENHLSLSDLRDKISSVAAPSEKWLVYDDPQGSRPFLSSVARFFARYFLPETLRPPSHDAFVATCGAGTAVDLLATVLCDEGDGVLLPGPGYGGFARDLTKRAGTKIVVANTEPSFRVSESNFDEAMRSATEAGITVSMLLITSPQNPTGQVLSAQEIRDIVSWGRAHKLQMVFDEAYALSIYGHNVNFCSVAHAMDGNLGDDIHIVWTASKDFCWSGARVGIIFSQNESVLNVLRPALTYLAGSSRQTQWTLMKLLEDEEWVEGFVRENRRRLYTSSSRMKSFLEEHDIPFFPANAGLFLWVDLRKWMRGSTLDDELELWERVAKQKVLLTPSNEQFGETRGFFRLCFAAVDDDALQLALRRIFTDDCCPLRITADEKK